MQRARILIVDDEPDMLEVCSESLEALQADVLTESSVDAALERLRRESMDVLVTDLRMPGSDGLYLLRAAREIQPHLISIVLTGYPTIQTAVQAIRDGAFDYLTKPFSPDKLRLTVEHALKERDLAEENCLLRGQVAGPGRHALLLGEGPAMRKMREAVDRIAPTDSDVLILGETGTGKELVARMLHARSRRKDGPFVPVDCGAIPEHLLEEDLFGHERGAYTGAHARALGLLEFAHRGTLFLDEVCELSLSLQAKLLRCLQERQFRRLGGRAELRVDIRVIAATNRDIDAAVQDRQFRQDLFYRLNVIRLATAPLREHVEDIPELSQHFLQRYAAEMEHPVQGMDAAALEVLGRYPWPGNVRELQNTIRHAVAMCRGSRITPGDLPEALVERAAESHSAAAGSGFYRLRTEEMARIEQGYLHALLQRHSGDVQAALAESGLTRTTLYRLLHKHNLQPDAYRSTPRS